MQWFVQPNSIVRRIWGDADVVMLIFAAGAAEFALNRAVDWLFFTGAIPNDPLGRLFETAAYTQDIIFAEQEQAWRASAPFTRRSNGRAARRFPIGRTVMCFIC
jgi:hypothetical protein